MLWDVEGEVNEKLYQGRDEEGAEGEEAAPQQHVHAGDGGIGGF